MEIRAKGISKEFIRVTASSNVFVAVDLCDIDLKPGTITVLKGRSGGGKTTFMNILAGLLEPTKGQVLYDDKDIFSLGDNERSAFRNRYIGYVPQGKSALSSLTVRENILLPCMLFNELSDDKAEELMKKFSIESIRDAYPDELSGGELRRMAIARAVIRDPEVIFADEPTGDLDDENTRIVFEMLRGLANNGKTVFVVTHEDISEKYADKIYLMKEGRLEG